ECTAGDRRLLPATGKIEPQAWYGLPVRLEFSTLHVSVVVGVDRGAIDDLRNLIASVVVVEHIAVDRQGTIEQCVLGAKFEGFNIFRLESQRMNDKRRIRGADLREYRSRRIGTASFVSVGVGSVDKSLIGKVKLWSPVENGTSCKAVPFLVFRS